MDSAQASVGLEIAEPPQCDLKNAVLLSCDWLHKVPPSQCKIFREAVNGSRSSFTRRCRHLATGIKDI